MVNCNARVLWLFVSLFLLSIAQANTKPLLTDIGTGISPPYQYIENGKLIGNTVNVVRCAFDKESLAYKIDIYPWRRALTLLSNDDLDMVFGVADTGLWAAHSTSSAPLDLEKWFWYSTTNNHTPTFDSSIAVVPGSNQDVWLQKNGYTNLFNPPTIESSAKMLLTNRIEFTLADETYFDQLLLTQKKPDQVIYKSFSRFSQHHAYFSTQYLNSHPEFLEKFDSHIGECSPSIRAITTQTKQALEKSAMSLLNELDLNTLVMQLKNANKIRPDLSLEYIVAQEKKWAVAGNELKKSSLLHSSSESFRGLAKSNAEIIREVFLIDNMGLTIAMNIPTSDYWQGDEDNFISVAKDSRRKHFISDVYFDDSTRSFQSQVSIRIDDPDSSEFLGVIVFGLSLERVMEKYLKGIEVSQLQ